MSSAVRSYLLTYYNIEIVQMIVDKYGISEMNALRRFIGSETYRMLIDPELEMWDFSPCGLFDMWESEQITGNPRNSLYIRRN